LCRGAAARSLEGPATLRIEFLADCPDVVACVSRWLGRNWFNRLGRSLRQREKCLRLRMNRGRLPLGLVAFVGQEPVGTASIARDEVPWEQLFLCRSATRETACLTGVYVVPHWRGQGIGAALCRRALAEARRLGLPSLDLYTANRPTFYTRLGWANPVRSVVEVEGRCQLRTFLEHRLT
jgi:GNAT superfamily N-acetyltransferase